MDNDSDIDYSVVADHEDVLSQQFSVDKVQQGEMDTTNSSLGKRPREYVGSLEQNLKLQKQRKLDVELDSNGIYYDMYIITVWLLLLTIFVIIVFFIVDYVIDDFTESKMVVLAEEIKYPTPTTHFQLSELLLSYYRRLSGTLVPFYKYLWSYDCI